MVKCRICNKELKTDEVIFFRRKMIICKNCYKRYKLPHNKILRKIKDFYLRRFDKNVSAKEFVNKH